MHNLIFFGSDQYSALVIKALIESHKFAEITVITDQAKPKDREQKIEPNPAEKVAITHNIKVSYYPPNIEELSKHIDSDTIGLCTSFDHLVPSEIINLFEDHLYNLHPSLLPQYRNVAPVQYALALGDTETGITLFRISEGIDNGEIVGQVREPILPEDTTPTLSTRLFEKGANLFLRSDLVGCKPDQKPTRSDLVGIPLIFTRRLTRDSGHIESTVLQKLLAGESVAATETTNHLLKLRLSQSLKNQKSVLRDLVRALTPWPGVWTIVPTTKGDLRMSIESVEPNLMVKLAGKPKAIPYTDFAKYYLVKQGAR